MLMLSSVSDISSVLIFTDARKLKSHKFTDEQRKEGNREILVNSMSA